MVCRHSLKVLVHLDVAYIPSRNIMERWLKSVGPVIVAQKPDGSLVSEGSSLVRRLLLSKVYEIANKEGMSNDAELCQALKALENIGSSADGTADDKSPESFALVSSGDELPTQCPPRTMVGGRPPSTGLKAFMSRSKKKKKVPFQTNDMILADWPDEENPPSKKTMRKIMCV